MNHRINLSSLIVLAVLPLGVLAAEPPSGGMPGNNAAANPNASVLKEQPPPMFEALDTNHDGYVTLEEAKRSADVTARFKELDRNHDGKISAAEFKDGLQAKM